MNSHIKIIFILIIGTTFSNYAMTHEKKVPTNYSFLTTHARTVPAPQETYCASSTQQLAQQDEAILYKDKKTVSRSVSTPRAIIKQESAQSPRTKSCSFSPNDAKHFQHCFMSDASSEQSDATTSTTTPRSRSEYSSYSWESGNDSDIIYE
jgi:flagellar basal body L-ring protein FlgH